MTLWFDGRDISELIKERAKDLIKAVDERNREKTFELLDTLTNLAIMLRSRKSQ